LTLSIRPQIGDEHAVPADGRDHDRIAELACEDAELANGATLEQLGATLDKLRQLRHRVDQRQLEPDDWSLLCALLREEMT
jgi:hypothetical protein